MEFEIRIHSDHMQICPSSPPVTSVDVLLTGQLGSSEIGTNFWIQIRAPHDICVTYAAEGAAADGREHRLEHPRRLVVQVDHGDVAAGLGVSDITLVENLRLGPREDAQPIERLAVVAPNEVVGAPRLQRDLTHVPQVGQLCKLDLVSPLRQKTSMRRTSSASHVCIVSIVVEFHTPRNGSPFCSASGIHPASDTLAPA